MMAGLHITLMHILLLGTIYSLTIADDIKINRTITNFWAFNGNFLDYVGKANLIDPENVVFATDRFGNDNSAISLKYGSITIPSDTYFNRDFSITAWVSLSSYDHFSRLIDCGTDSIGDDNVIVAFSYFSTGRPYMEIDNVLYGIRSFYDKENKLPLNAWTFLAVTLRTNHASIYVNGVKSATKKVLQPRNLTRSQCFIGKSYNKNDSLAYAKIDDLIFFNKGLNKDEIVSVMKSDINLIDTKFVSQVSLKKNSATTKKLTTTTKANAPILNAVATTAMKSSTTTSKKKSTTTSKKTSTTKVNSVSTTTTSKIISLNILQTTTSKKPTTTTSNLKTTTSKETSTTTSKKTSSTTSAKTTTTSKLQTTTSAKTTTTSKFQTTTSAKTTTTSKKHTTTSKKTSTTTSASTTSKQQLQTTTTSKKTSTTTSKIQTSTTSKTSTKTSSKSQTTTTNKKTTTETENQKETTIQITDELTDASTDTTTIPTTETVISDDTTTILTTETVISDDATTIPITETLTSSSTESTELTEPNGENSSTYLTTETIASTYTLTNDIFS